MGRECLFHSRPASNHFTFQTSVHSPPFLETARPALAHAPGRDPLSSIPALGIEESTPVAEKYHDQTSDSARSSLRRHFGG
jgi:hypothetical protein